MWGRKKASLSSSASRPSLISSWLGKFKKMGGSGSSRSSEQKPETAKHIGELNCPSRALKNSSRTGGRFYGEDGNTFWRISFAEECADGSTSKNLVQSTLYDSYDQLDVPEASCQSGVSCSTIAEGKEETRKYGNVLFDAGKTRDIFIEARELPKLNISRRKAEENFDISGRVARQDCELITRDRICLEEKQSEIEEKTDAAEFKNGRVSENDIVEHGLVETIRTYVSSSKIYGDGSSIKSEGSYAGNHDLNKDKGDGVFCSNVSPDWRKLKELKIAEFKARTEKQRKSVYMSRELHRNKSKQGSKVRVFSPRTTPKVEVCKIKALEDMKKANRLRMKKKISEILVGGKCNLENFAVVKCSYDPKNDFRDSMIQMIIEKRMRRPEELEELLACYLTLNSDEYHDLIIKVFKEVWFQLNQLRTELHDKYCC